jgi:hypothetical protein
MNSVCLYYGLSRSVGKQETYKLKVIAYISSQMRLQTSHDQPTR